jgi:aldose 1-epimerase
MQIAHRPFGVLPDGTKVACWTITSDAGLQAEVMDYGATIRCIRVPDRDGRLTDVVLGYDTLEGYVGNRGFFGATIGRFANRIGGAEFELNGRRYPLAKNNGQNHLHGGTAGFDKRVFHAEPEADGVSFRYISPDGEEGYPGKLAVSVKIGWQGNGLHLQYRAESDSDTILNLTNHSYFNLDGRGDVQKQFLTLSADFFTPNDKACLPTGEIVPVDGTAMDFRMPKAIGQDADRDESFVGFSGGYDANFVLTGRNPAAVASSHESGIVMRVITDQPGIQLYTANNMVPRAGKGGAIYGHRAAFCLETQHFPDCIHHADWPSCILRKGEVFHSTTIYEFSAQK